MVGSPFLFLSAKTHRHPGYTKHEPPAPCPNFNGPQQLGGAIQAPLANGIDTYQGVKYYPGPYNPKLCAAACQAQTAYNKRHAKNGTYKPCVCTLRLLSFLHSCGH